MLVSESEQTEELDPSENGNLPKGDETILWCEEEPYCSKSPTLRMETMARGSKTEPKWIEMPSLPARGKEFSLDPGQDYHDLGELYADAPVARGQGDVLVHRAILDDITGIPKILDWLSDGDIVILEMSRLITVKTELRIAVDQIQSFVETDLSGEVIRLGTSRLLLIPPTFAISEDQNTAY
ncbi:MAG: hypothetical protein VW551_01090 [Euryarchaeota archaeon]